MWKYIASRQTFVCRNSHLLRSFPNHVTCKRCSSDEPKVFPTKEELLANLHKEGVKLGLSSKNSLFKYPAMFHPDFEQKLKSNEIVSQDELRISPNSLPGIELSRSRLFTDTLVIGGGLVGSSIAYALKTKSHESFNLLVLERDPKYLHASSAISVGGIQQLFSIKENIEMAKYSTEFIRNARRYLNVFEEEPPDMNFQPQGHLTLSNLKNADSLRKNFELSVSMNQSLEMYNKTELAARFPWLNVSDDIALGTYGTQNEGWYDPFSLLLGFRGKASFLGADFMEAELIDFNMRIERPQSPGQPVQELVNHAIIRKNNGSLEQIQFARLVVAAGPENAEIARLLGIGEAEGQREVPAPFKKRKRYYYAFDCADGPGLDFPLLVDPSGVFVRREGLGGRFVTGKNPSEDEEIDNYNSDVDYRYFEHRILPVLVNRVPAFANLKLLQGWAAFEDVNTFDQQPIITNHPAFSNVLFAGGLGANAIHLAPAIGKGIAEYILSDDFVTIDLNRFNWRRYYFNQPLK